MDCGSDKKVIKDETRIDLLGNQFVLIAPNDSKLDNVIIGPDFNLARLVGDGRSQRRMCARSAGREICDGSTGKAWVVERCRIEICND